ncbi:zinc ABC transporter permease subunit ZnuB [Gilvimarinus sp. F26214L]|uniref:zinc ABC transporter permease subunit ZnuB n=1 Tax=Gilvimarinus sp. DZF01 TaxID=3461371 RepID=UPI004045C658
MLPEFLINAVLAGLGVALVAGPLGSFVVWRRMAYLGDTLAHSALLGVALGLALSVNINASVVIVCASLALVFVALQRNRNLATDTLLGILAHSSLALGLVSVALLGGTNVDLYSYLFGDLLAVSRDDVVAIFAVSAVVLALLGVFWRRLLAITVHEELAQVDGVNVPLVRTILMLIMALVIAMAMRAVGVLLITALLIIPAAASRRVARSPEQMAVFAAVIAALAVLGGLTASFYVDTPAGPSVVLAAGALFVVSLLKPQH